MARMGRGAARRERQQQAEAKRLAKREHVVKKSSPPEPLAAVGPAAEQAIAALVIAVLVYRYQAAKDHEKAMREWHGQVRVLREDLRPIEKQCCRHQIQLDLLAENRMRPYLKFMDSAAKALDTAAGRLRTELTPLTAVTPALYKTTRLALAPNNLSSVFDVFSMTIPQKKRKKKAETITVGEVQFWINGVGLVPNLVTERCQRIKDLSAWLDTLSYGDSTRAKALVR